MVPGEFIILFLISNLHSYSVMPPQGTTSLNCMKNGGYDGDMIRSKNISLDDECLKKMEPLVTKHNGNFSSARTEGRILEDTIFKPPPRDQL